MRNATRLIVLAATVLVIAAGAAGRVEAGQVLTYNFTAEVFVNSSASPYSAGDTVTGTFSYELGAEVLRSGDTSADYRTGSVAVAGLLSAPFNLHFTQVLNNNPEDGIYVSNTFYEGGQDSEILSIYLIGSSGVWDSTSLPGQLPAPNSFDNYFRLSWNKDSGSTHENFAANVTSYSLVSAVPEPPTLIGTATAGLFGLGYCWRRRKVMLAA